jgi:sugar phosphate isomerase/epimerase
MTRREILALAGTAPAWLGSASRAATVPTKPKMGGAPTAFSVRSRGGRGFSPGNGPARGARGAGGPPAAAGGRSPRPQSSFDIVQHCKNIGLAGVQTNPPAMDAESIKKFRERLESLNLYLISDVNLPTQASDLDQFETQVKAYKDAGALFFHVALTGRRYEEFDAVGPWKEMVDRIHKQGELAEPILRKHQMKLGFENHKGYRSVEQAAWLKHMSSEYLGVCFDFGNNVSLCETPDQTLKTLLPYIFYTHIKDMGVQEYPDGFLLSEVVMGDGALDLKGMVQTLRQKDPNHIFLLEMITRDPLKIPVFTDKYWATFDDTLSPLPGRDLAKVLEWVKKNPPKKPLPMITGLSPEAAVKLEDDLNLANIAWARQNLDL